MTSKRRLIRAGVIGATGAWLVIGCLYVSTIWWIYAVTHHPPIVPGARWNNFWINGGRFGWSRYDPSAAQYPMRHTPPSWRASVRPRNGGSWFWGVYHAKQNGGWFIGVPLWIPMAALTPPGPVAGGVMMARARRRRRRHAGRACGRCAYPLGGLPGDRCPECGHVAGGTRG